MGIAAVMRSIDPVNQVVLGRQAVGRGHPGHVPGVQELGLAAGGGKPLTGFLGLVKILKLLNYSET